MMVSMMSSRGCSLQPCYMKGPKRDRDSTVQSIFICFHLGRE
jgi:hypothetical protein